MRFNAHRHVLPYITLLALCYAPKFTNYSPWQLSFPKFSAFSWLMFLGVPWVTTETQG